MVCFVPAGMNHNNILPVLPTFSCISRFFYVTLFADALLSKIKAREFSVDRSTLASLCLWQLVTGYKLREAEATGKAKELMGR